MKRSQTAGIPFGDAIAEALPKVRQRFNHLFDDEPEVSKPQPKSNKPLTRPRTVSDKSRAPSKPSAKKRSFSELDPGIRTIVMRAAKASGLSEQEYMESM